MAKRVVIGSQEGDVGWGAGGGRTRESEGGRIGPNFLEALLWNDDLAGRKVAREAAGARLLYLPSYSPDFNPIKMAFSKIKALLRKTAERTVERRSSALGHLVDAIT